MNKITQPLSFIRYFYFLIILLVFFISSGNVFAIDFNYKDLDGQSHQLSQDKGKWVLVNFWATWCPPCRKEIPDLSDFHLENDNAIVIGVNYEPGITIERLKKFSELYLVSYPMTQMNDEIIDALGEPRGLPTSILVNPEGDVVKKFTGMISDRTLKKYIAQYNKK
ncbi:MAG: TlpA family protein disulfide reductase [gamma proteobacterium symbiont of Taylorina sp.]|nr:TlpA family protein disulfide reductase [gamma proteobacterium symbiont of Taylorina sp.]